MSNYIIRRRLRKVKILSELHKKLFKMLQDFEVVVPHGTYAHYVAFTEDEWIRLKSGLFFPKFESIGNEVPLSPSADGNGGEVPKVSMGEAAKLFPKEAKGTPKPEKEASQ